MSDQTCTYHCDVPVTSTTLCTTHVQLLRGVALELAWMVGQLHDVETRQVSYARSTRSGDVKPLLFNPSAERLADTYAGLLLGWQAQLADWLGEPVRFTTHRDAAVWIRRAVRDGRTVAYPAAGAMLHDLHSALTEAYLIIDRPDDTWFAGRCDHPWLAHDHTSCSCTCHRGGDTCSIGADCADHWEPTCSRGIYASKDEGTATCDVCETVHDVAARRRALLVKAKTFALTTTEIALAIVTWGDMDVTETKLRNRIKQWHARGRIQPSGHLTERGQLRPIYRLGAVMDLLEDERQRRANRAHAG